MRLMTLADVREIALPSHCRDGGELVVMQYGKELPFAAARMFTVRAPKDAVRGRHAHKRCAQFLVCVHGLIEVECDDGMDTARYVLDRADKALLVPPSIWATETYRMSNSILSVLCDLGYDADDYVRDYDQFLTWRRSNP
jgi:hypothetical protein